MAALRLGNLAALNSVQMEFLNLKMGRRLLLTLLSVVAVALLFIVQSVRLSAIKRQ